MYCNSNYGNYPYPQYQQMAQCQQQIIQPNVKVVNNFNDIMASDVPMNTPYSIFPKADMSEIALKRWNANGLIETIVYKAHIDENNANVSNVSNDTEKSLYGDYNAIVDGLMERIEDRFEKIEKLLKPGKKKESEMNENKP